MPPLTMKGSEEREEWEEEMLSLFDSNPLFNPSIATDVASPQTQGGQPAHAPRPPPALDDSVQGLGDWEGEMAAIFGSNGLFAPAPDKEDGQARVKRCAKTEAGTARGGNAAAAEGRGGAAAGAGDAKWRNDASLEELRALQAEFARARGWEQHHIPRSIALALVGEAGELAECFQWKKDAQCENGLQGWSEEERTHLGEELSDVLLYLVRLADVCDVDLAAAARRKLDKNGRKYPADRVNGSSAKYTAYAARDTQAGGLRPPEQ